MVIIVSKSKNSATYYVQKSFRNREGKVSTKIVERLGSYDDLIARFGPDDPLALAKEYAKELTAKEKASREKVSVSYNPTAQLPRGEQRRYNGGYLFLQKCYYELGLDKICKKISAHHHFDYDLNDILSKLLYSRILYPSSKLGTYELSENFLEGRKFELHQIYRALEVLSKESDFIQKEVFRNSSKATSRKTGVIYYDCTNFFFESEQAEGLKQYGMSKERRANPIVQLGLFMDAEGLPLSFCINPGNTNEQVTMRPLEQKLSEDFGLSRLVVCTDAGLSSAENRKYNNVGGRSFITVQSLKNQKKHIEGWLLEREGWSCMGAEGIFSLDDIDEDRDRDKMFYRERWFNEDGLEQRMIVTYSVKYKQFQLRRRGAQIERAANAASRGASCLDAHRDTDYKRFLRQENCTPEGEVATFRSVSIDEDKIASEERYDGLYAVCTNLEDDVREIVKINSWRWQIEDCFRIMKSEFKARPVFLKRDDRIRAHFLTFFLALLIFKYLDKKLCSVVSTPRLIDTLQGMDFVAVKGHGYVPAYTRTQVTDFLHSEAGFNTDREIISTQAMHKIISQSKMGRPSK